VLAAVLARVLPTPCAPRDRRKIGAWQGEEKERTSSAPKLALLLRGDELGSAEWPFAAVGGDGYVCGGLFCRLALAAEWSLAKWHHGGKHQQGHEEQLFVQSHLCWPCSVWNRWDCSRSRLCVNIRGARHSWRQAEPGEGGQV